MELVNKEDYLTLVQSVQPTDVDTMQRLALVQPGDSEMMERLLNPVSSAVYSASGKLVGISSPETRFLEEWKRLQQQAIIPESQVRKWSQARYARFAYFAHWFPQPGVRVDYKLCWTQWRQYHFEGITALAGLFAEETFNSTRFRKAEQFPQFDNFPRGTFKNGETACSHSDWQKGFTLALLRFGTATIEDSFVKETVHEFSGDVDFIQRYTKEIKHGSRQMLLTLCRFACDWDLHVVPLRYFTPGAAADFVLDQYGYATDMKRFGTIFYKGGNQKECPGLKLERARPPIVRGWNKQVILLNAAAAATHGYDALALASVLEKRYERPVRI